ncbi:MAG: tRNA 5'-guanylyltransferase [Methanoregulaceae archaeon]|nr:tRNA 5'-guanylyltransferase [Methanoregulaceae archaeon]
MKDRELFSNLTAIPPVFLRLDGRAFHRFTARLELDWPYDARFCTAMARTCCRLISESGLSPEFAYTFSDEINLYLAGLPFSGRVEKIDSVAASFAASALTIELASTVPLAFDARVVQVSPALAVDYLADRQREAWRNHINASTQAALVEDGLSPREAARRLKGMPSAAMHELMYSRGINLAKTPAWQRRGVLAYKRERQISGIDPRTGAATSSTRSTVTVDREPPVFSSPEGQAFLSGLVGKE